MDIGQAVRRLIAGDRVRREAWEEKDRHLDPDASGEIYVDFTYEDLFANDWEIYDG